MTLSDLASIGSLVSGGAVLVSLVYLSLQIRQTEKNQRALMNQGVISRSVDAIMWNAQPDMSDLFTRVRSGEKEFSAQEITRLALSLRVLLLGGQDAYIQYKAGLSDEITIDAIRSALKFWLAMPVYRALWASARLNYAPEWVVFVDKLIETVPLAKPEDIVAGFNSALANVER